MTSEAEKKYWICCPLCDNDKCMKGTDKCEAEKWEKEEKALSKRFRQMAKKARDRE
jgi:hypothetical protein